MGYSEPTLTTRPRLPWEFEEAGARCGEPAFFERHGDELTPLPYLCKAARCGHWGCRLAHHRARAVDLVGSLVAGRRHHVVEQAGSNRLRNVVHVVVSPPQAEVAYNPARWRARAAAAWKLLERLGCCGAARVPHAYRMVRGSGRLDPGSDAPPTHDLDDHWMLELERATWRPGPHFHFAAEIPGSWVDSGAAWDLVGPGGRWEGWVVKVVRRVLTTDGLVRLLVYQMSHATGWDRRSKMLERLGAWRRLAGDRWQDEVEYRHPEDGRGTELLEAMPVWSEDGLTRVHEPGPSHGPRYVKLGRWTGQDNRSHATEVRVRQRIEGGWCWRIVLIAGAWPRSDPRRSWLDEHFEPWPPPPEPAQRRLGDP